MDIKRWQESKGREKFFDDEARKTVRQKKNERRGGGESVGNNGELRSGDVQLQNIL